MESEDKHEVNTTDDFWTQIESVLSTPCETHDNIDDVLRSYLALLEEHHGMFALHVSDEANSDLNREIHNQR